MEHHSNDAVLDVRDVSCKATLLRMDHRMNNDGTEHFGFRIFHIFVV